MAVETGQRLLLLCGSPRKQGTSYSFARTLGALAAEAGATTEIEFVYDYFGGRRQVAALRERIAACDVIGLVSPLYYDTLPGAVVWLFEQLYAQMPEAMAGKSFFAIGQSAYPFVALMQPLIGQCRCFAAAVGMKWLGGLGYGGGVLIDGALLESQGRKGRKITAAFRLALADVLDGRVISARPQELLTMRIPKLLLGPFAAVMNFRIRAMARRTGVPDLGGQVY